MADEILAELRHGDTQRRMETEIASGLWAYADPYLLRIALENLLGNAWKFSEQRKIARISLRVQESNGQQVFLVGDNGAGFDMANVSKLFAPFQRLHTQREFQGIGIGLTTVQRIIQLHGGRIWAESALDQGATFYFTLD